MDYFRLNSATIGIERKDGKDIAITLPAGAEIATAESLDTDPESHSKLIEARLGEKTIRVFLLDLLERGQRVSSLRGFAGGA